MELHSWFLALHRSPVIAVIRAPEFTVGLKMAKAVVAGGIQLVEITWNSDRAADLINHLRQKLPNCLIGAGTLLTLEQEQQAIAAGAQFLFTPHVSGELIQNALSQQVPIVAGALSPSEIVQAWQAGATCVKVFPVQALGGATYIHSLQGPLGHIPLIPTGGVTLKNTPDLLQAGAVAVGLAGDLFPKEVIQQGKWMAITQRAKTLIESLQGCRQNGTIAIDNGLQRNIEKL
ncbi:MAG: bifunctional 4-hydroxy-2-oxoglutarate aldolase/2-dehydro-3-deoxy-phosphogluconate aldolase [Leptodesmis sp.]|uniref:bifunctional 4-hydroxy-2-oxoglutarate aldolase/2-dehydro-3-deoxy-phosphogluconate aldolase n=1 Tax=Leptodesmis sp. TaxID=3100501 RepID=UPI003D0A3807